MMRALYTAATGMAAQQRNIDTTANNLANVNTTGYKKSKVHFQDLLYHNERTAGVPSSVSTQVPVGLHVGHGVKFIGTEKIHTQGNLENTGNDLDLSIDGHGFFQILQPNGIVGYSRDGHFNIDGMLPEPCRANSDRQESLCFNTSIGERHRRCTRCQQHGNLNSRISGTLECLPG